MAWEEEEKGRSCRRYGINECSHREMFLGGEIESMMEGWGYDGRDSGGLPIKLGRNILNYAENGFPDNRYVE